MSNTTSTEKTKEQIQEEIDLTQESEFVKRVKEELQNRSDRLGQYVDEMVKYCGKLLKEEKLSGIDVEYIIARTIGYVSQVYCDNQEEFMQFVDRAQRLVINNVIPSLGFNANNPELNKNATVTYNGEFDKENFRYVTILLISSSIILSADEKIIQQKVLKQMELEEKNKNIENKES